MQTRDVDPVAVQRRTLDVLAGDVAPSGLGVTVGITVGGLLGCDVANSDTAAGLLDGRRARRRGRRRAAGPHQRPRRTAGRARRRRVSSLPLPLPLPLLLLGRFAFGAATACGLQARYAAADLAAPEHRGRALSLVVWATTVGSVLGPNLAGPGEALGAALGLPPLTGAFAISVAGFAVVALGLLALLRPDPLLLARRLRGTGAGSGRPCRATTAAVGAVWADPRGRLGLTAVVVSHAVMVCGHDAGADGPRRGDDAACHRPGDQRARRRHVRVLDGSEFVSARPSPSPSPARSSGVRPTSMRRRALTSPGQVSAQDDTGSCPVSSECQRISRDLRLEHVSRARLSFQVSESRGRLRSEHSIVPCSDVL